MKAALLTAQVNLRFMYPVMLTVVSAGLNESENKINAQEAHTQKHTLKVMIHLRAEMWRNSVFDIHLPLIWIHLPLAYQQLLPMCATRANQSYRREAVKAVYCRP